MIAQVVSVIARMAHFFPWSSPQSIQTAERPAIDTRHEQGTQPPQHGVTHKPPRVFLEVEELAKR